MHTSSFPDPASPTAEAGDAISLWRPALTPPPPPQPSPPVLSDAPPTADSGSVSQVLPTSSPSPSPVFRERLQGRSRRCSLGQPAAATSSTQTLRHERSLDSDSSSPAMVDLTSIPHAFPAGAAQRLSPSASPSGTLVWLVPTDSSRRSGAASPTEGSHHSDSGVFPASGDQLPLPLPGRGPGGSGGVGGPMGSGQQRSGLGISGTSFCSNSSWADPPLAHFVRPVSTSFEISPLASPRRQGGRGGLVGGVDVGSLSPQHSLPLDGEGRISRRATDLIDILPPIHQEEQPSDGSLLLHFPTESSSAHREDSTRARRLSSTLGRSEGESTGSSTAQNLFPSQEPITAAAPTLNQQSSQHQFPKGASSGEGETSPSTPPRGEASLMGAPSWTPNEGRDADSILVAEGQVE
jgi:hypothetical protein